MNMRHGRIPSALSSAGFIGICILALVGCAWPRDDAGLKPLPSEAVDGLATPPVVAPQVRRDRVGRLRLHDALQPLPCPPMGSSTLVVWVLGQSNAANHAQVRDPGAEGVYFSHADRCYRAASPFLGGTGTGGEIWTDVGRRSRALMGRKVVLFWSFAVTGSTLARWQPGSDLHPLFVQEAGDEAVRRPPDVVIWIQGESDWRRQTTEEAYVEGFQRWLDGLRGIGVTAPVLVAVSTRCGARSQWVPDNPIARAQRQLPQTFANVLPGVDLDVLLPPAMRRDGCHYNKRGQALAAEAWSHRLARVSGG